MGLARRLAKAVWGRTAQPLEAGVSGAGSLVLCPAQEQHERQGRAPAICDLLQMVPKTLA